MRKAAHLAGQKLAGSLALVTCKDPLRQNMPGHMRMYLSDHGFSEQMVPDQVVNILVENNLDIACEAIEKAAMERAIREVDVAINGSLEVRRRHREMRPGHPFWDTSAIQAPYISNLPDPLRIKSTGLSPVQLRVYEEFGMLIIYNSDNNISYIIFVTSGADNKRPLASRPGSTVYSRDGSVRPFPSSPVQDGAAPMFLAQEQFNVCIVIELEDLDTDLELKHFLDILAESGSFTRGVSFPDLSRCARRP